MFLSLLLTLFIHPFNSAYGSISVEPTELKLQAKTPIAVIVVPPQGSHLNLKAPNRITLLEGKQVIQEFRSGALSKNAQVVLPQLKSQSSYLLQSVLFHCTSQAGAACEMEKKEFKIQTELSPFAATSIQIPLTRKATQID